MYSLVREGEGKRAMRRVSTHSKHAQAIVRYLQRRGAWCTRLHGSMWQRRGLPDILACWQGTLLAIEVKAGQHSRLSPHQKAELDALHRAGAVVLVGDAPSVIEQLRQLTGDLQPTLLDA